MRRMAGGAIEDYLGTGPDMSAIVQKGAVRDAKLNIAEMQNESLLGQASVSQTAETLAHQAVTEAQGKLTGAQQQASNMSKVGGLLGQGISMFGE